MKENPSLRKTDINQSMFSNCLIQVCDSVLSDYLNTGKKGHKWLLRKNINLVHTYAPRVPAYLGILVYCSSFFHNDHFHRITWSLVIWVSRKSFNRIKYILTCLLREPCMIQKANTFKVPNVLQEIGLVLKSTKADVQENFVIPTDLCIWETPVCSSYFYLSNIWTLTAQGQCIFNAYDVIM